MTRVCVYVADNSQRTESKIWVIQKFRHFIYNLIKINNLDAFSTEWMCKKQRVWWQKRHLGKQFFVISHRRTQLFPLLPQVYCIVNVYGLVSTMKMYEAKQCAYKYMFIRVIYFVCVSKILNISIPSIGKWLRRSKDTNLQIKKIKNK